MFPELGLVCITVSKDVRYRTVTRKRLLELSDAGQRKVLDDIYRDNIQTLDRALQYCKREGIRLYRLPSSIFPFFDEDVGREVDPWRESEPQRRPRRTHCRTAVREHQLVHISNGREDFNDRQHADLISVMPSSYARAPWIEIEAKNKEEAIAKLRGWQGQATAIG
jgi:UV DNA damage endonuclease